MSGLTIAPLRAEAKPPEDSKIVGQHTDGRAIYEREIVEVVGKEHVEIEGVKQYRKHPTTGEPLTPILRQVKRTRKQRFVLEVTNVGTVYINEGFEPDAEEKARLEMKAAEAKIQGELVSEMAKRGLTAADLLNAITPAEPVKRGKKGE